MFDIKKEVDEITKDVVSWKNHLHQNPELAMQEYKTTKFIYELLISFGIEDVCIASDNIGVIATIYGKDKNNAVALRADIDALAIVEDTDDIFKSKNDGVMHACGHDAHTAILLGVAKILFKEKDFLTKSIRLIFQPGEEGLKGAKHMIKNHALENINIECVLALHVCPFLNAGSIYYKYGVLTASSDRFAIRIEGKQGHAAMPHKTVDPIVIAGHTICAVQSIVSREMDPIDSNVISLCTIHGGTLANIIPNEVEIKGTIRSLNKESRDYMLKRIVEVVELTAKVHNGKSIVELQVGVGSVVNDDKLSDIVLDAIKKEIGEDKCLDYKFPTMGGEDFAFYLENIRGMMYKLGTGFDNEENHALHSNHFKVNNEAIPTGMITLLASVLSI